MKKSNMLAAGFLGFGFAWVSYVMLFVEPGMGFASPADYFDAQKVAEGYTSVAWFVSNIIYLALPIAVLTIGNSTDDRLLQWAAACSALLWLVVGAVDRVGIQLPALLPTNEAVLAAVGSTLPVRFAVLKSAVVTLGVVAWRTTCLGTGTTAAARLWRALGWLVMLVSVGFMFAFIPVPVAFTIWALVLAARSFRASPRGPEPAAVHA